MANGETAAAIRAKLQAAFAPERLEIVALLDRWDAGVDALLDEVGDRQPGGVLDHHDQDQELEGALVRPQQPAQQPPRGAAQPRRLVLVADLLSIGLEDPAPLAGPP